MAPPGQPVNRTGTTLSRAPASQGIAHDQDARRNIEENYEGQAGDETVEGPTVHTIEPKVKNANANLNEHETELPKRVCDIIKRQEEVVLTLCKLGSVDTELLAFVVASQHCPA